VGFRVLAEEEDYVARGLDLYAADGLDLFVLTSPPQADEQIRQRYAGEYISFPLLNTFYVGFDVRRPPFSDVRVRQAFVLATDRAGLADVALLGYPVPAAGGFLPPGMPGHSPGIGLPYDPEQARQLLAKAGYPGGRGLPALTMVAPQASAQHLEGSLRAQWRQNLGIEVQWEGVAWIDLWDRLQAEQPALHFNGWVGDLPDPDNFLRVAVQLQVASDAGWRHTAYEHLVEEARRVMDQAERIRLYRQADQMLVEEAPIMPVAYGRRQGLVKPWVKQLSGSALGWFSLKDVVLEPH
jgi:ABC-type transport system substrate-binding protein